MVAPHIVSRPGARYPEGPRLSQRLLSGEFFRQNAADFMLSTASRFGDLNHFTGFGRQIFQFNHPQLIQELLLRDALYHLRGLVMQRARLVLGEGLLTSEAPLHRRPAPVGAASLSPATNRLLWANRRRLYRGNDFPLESRK